MNKPLRILVEATGLKLLYKLLKRCYRPLKSAAAAQLQGLQISSETLGPPKGLTEIAAYATRRGLDTIPIFPAELRADPVQRFESTGTQLQRSLTTEFTPTTILESYVNVLPRGRVIDVDGLVITDEDQVVTETLGSYRGSASPHPIFSSLRLPRLQHYAGRLALVGYNYAHGYYHWMLEVLPRFELLRRSGVAYDAIYMSPLVARFQREALEAIGFHSQNVIWAVPSTHIRADQLIVPSLPGAPGQIPRWVVNYLRELFLPKSPVVQDQFLLVSRRKAARRRILNETEVAVALQALGYREVVLEDYSLQEQARLFASAKGIVATHGAALTNLVFCSPGVKITELLAPTRYYNNFQVLSHLMDLDYQGLLTSIAGMGRTSVRKQDLQVDVPSLLQLLT